VIEMTSTIRNAALAGALVIGSVIGGVGVTQAFAQSASPAASSASNGSGNSSKAGTNHSCPNDRSGGSSGTGSTST
jgi:hypothetical protein